MRIHIVLLVIVVSVVGCTRGTTRTDEHVLRQVSVGMLEKDLLTKLAPNTCEHAIITWGGTGNHRLYLALSDKQQVTFEVEGPYGWDGAKITGIGEIQPLQNWAKIEGIQINPDKRDAGDGK